MRGIPTTPESKWNRIEASDKPVTSCSRGAAFLRFRTTATRWYRRSRTPIGRIVAPHPYPYLRAGFIPRNANAAFMASYEGLLVVSYDSKVVGIDASTGQLRWTSPVDSPITAPLGFDFTRGNV